MLGMVENIRFNSDNFKKFLKFGITGILNTGIHWGVYLLLVGSFGFNVYFSHTTGYFCGIINSYIINRGWTFKTNEKFISKQFLKFITLNGLMIVFSLILLYIFYDLVKLGYFCAMAISTMIVLVINFTANNTWVFGKKKRIDS